MTIKGITITKKRVLLVLCLIILLVFLFQLVKHNSTQKVADATVTENQKLIANFAPKDVETVQSQIDKRNQEAPPKSNHRSSSDRSRFQKIFGNSVVIGDSITEGLTGYGFLSEGQVFFKVGGSIMRDTSLFTSAAKTYPSNAFFSFGMNDMGNYRGDANAFVAQYKKLLKDFHAKSPKTNIFISSISLPSKSAQKKKPVLKNYKKFNQAISTMCQEEGYTFLDVTYLLSEHPEYYGSDGIHVSPGYYDLWLKQMALKAGL